MGERNHGRGEEGRWGCGNLTCGLKRDFETWPDALWIEHGVILGIEEGEVAE